VPFDLLVLPLLIQMPYILPECAYPTPIYEHIMNTQGGYKAFELAKATQEDQKAQKYLKESLVNIINNLR
jgi:hypothetical protein